MLAVKHKVVTNLPILEIENEMVIFEKGDQDFTMYFVLEGFVTLYVDNNDGSEKEVAVIKKNGFLGENEMYTRSARPVNAKITTPTKLVAIKTTKEFEKFVTENRWLSGKMMEDMSTKLAETNVALAAKIFSNNTQSNVVLEVKKEDQHGTGGSVRRIIRH